MIPIPPFHFVIEDHLFTRYTGRGKKQPWRVLVHTLALDVVLKAYSSIPLELSMGSKGIQFFPWIQLQHSSNSKAVFRSDVCNEKSVSFLDLMSMLH